MSDPRTLRWLKKLDTNLTALRAEQQSAFAGLDVELHEHEERLDGHDDDIADHERRIKRLEKLANGRR